MKHLAKRMTLVVFMLVWALGAADARNAAGHIGSAAGVVKAELPVQAARLLAADGDEGDWFGVSVAIGGDTAVVGADRTGYIPFGPSGAAYVYERNQGGVDNWGHIKTLVASDPTDGDYFGRSTAVDGDTAVVGGNGSDGKGGAYVFMRNQGGGGNWGLVKKLVASDATANCEFGSFVAIAGDTIAVGAYGDDGKGGDAGAAYVFERNQGGANNWGQVRKLLAGDGVAGDSLGWTGALDGDTLVVTAAGDNGNGTYSGSAYVFGRNEGGAGNWGQVKKVVAADTVNFAWLGALPVALSQDTLALGDERREGGDGAAYLFSRNQGGANNWGQVKRLTGSGFGSAVAVEGDTLIVGAASDSVQGNLSGSAYVFDRNEGGAGNWGYRGKLMPSGGAANDLFGWSASISGRNIIFGAIGDAEHGQDSGSAYVFYAATGSGSVTYPASLPGGWMHVCVWDSAAGTWVMGHDVSSPPDFAFSGIITGRWYWIGVWEYVAGAWAFGDWYMRLE